MGVLVIKDDTVIDKNGILISQKQLPPEDSQALGTERKTLKILPPSN